MLQRYCLCDTRKAQATTTLRDALHSKCMNLKYRSLLKAKKKSQGIRGSQNQISIVDHDKSKLRGGGGILNIQNNLQNGVQLQKQERILCVSLLPTPVRPRAFAGSCFQRTAVAGLQESNNASVAEIIPGLNKLLLAFITTAA